MSRPWPPPTRADHERFVRNEGWAQVPSSHHETYELGLPDGTVLRTRISRPPDKTTYGPRMWAHILRDQLDVTDEEFWACVRDGAVPDRLPDDPRNEIGGAIPLDVVTLLLDRVGLTRQDIREMTRDEAIARLVEYWQPVAELRPVARPGVTAEVLLDRWRHLPHLDPDLLRDDLDSLIDPSL